MKNKSSFHSWYVCYSSLLLLLGNHVDLIQGTSIFEDTVEPMRAESTTVQESSDVYTTSKSNLYTNEADEDEGDDEMIQLLIKYKNDLGRQHAMDISTSGQLQIDIPTSRIASVRVHPSQRAELEKDPSIEKVEIDHPVRTMIHERGPFIDLDDISMKKILTEDEYEYEYEYEYEDKVDIEINVEDYNYETNNSVNMNISSTENTSTNYLRQHQRRHRQLKESTPYGILQVRAHRVPSIPSSSRRIKVCVVDTGYGMGHPDLPKTFDYQVRGYTSPGLNDDGSNTDDSVSWKVDTDSHGTHCAGTIGAIGGNEEGVVGVLKDPNKFRFFIAKGMTNEGLGTQSSILTAVQACVDAGSKVISMSFGGEGSSSIAREVYREHYENGVLFVAAAGNGGNSELIYPASYETVMSVAATNSNRGRAPFSQYNEQVEIAAPGVNIRSTVTKNNGETFGYAKYTGTSMATPHVAGVAALVWAHFPQCNNRQIRNVLLVSALDRGAVGCDSYLGFGIVQAKAAYDLLQRQGCDAGGDGDLLEPIGGCDQLGWTPAPTPSPTPCPSDMIDLEVQVLTDGFPEETSWKVRDIYGQWIMSGGNYLEGWTLQRKQACVPNGVYKFILLDSYGDGMEDPAKFRILIDGTVTISGTGRFTDKRVRRFPSCMDDPNLQYDDGAFKNCKWVKKDPSRCFLKWKNRKLNTICPVACGKCTPE